jgi:hypothetical protein
LPCVAFSINGLSNAYILYIKIFMILFSSKERNGWFL